MESVTSASAGGVVVCGSLGEVANDPSLNEIFAIVSEELTTTGDKVTEMQKHAVWAVSSYLSDNNLTM